MRLTAKILLVLLMAMALITGAACVFSVKTAYIEFEQQQQQIARQLGDQLNQRLAHAYEVDGMRGVANVLKEVSPEQRADVEMKWVLFENPNSPQAGSPGALTRLSQIRVGKVVSLIKEDSYGHRQLRTYFPVELANAKLGGLEISGSLQPVERETRRLIRSALVTIGGLAIASIGVVYVIGVRWVGRPLDALIAKTQRIGRGDFSTPLHLRGKGEFAQLAGALNEMCEKLTAQQSQLTNETTERLATLAQLRHADRLKTVGRLAAGLAHELGTPLNVVSGRAALIASGRLDAEQVTASAATIKAEADRITGIVRQLLDFARRSQPKRANSDLRPVIKRTLELLESLAEKQRVQLHSELPPEPIVCSIDDGQLQQVMTNLILNGIQAMADGGTLRITLETGVHKTSPEDGVVADWIRISIHDDGPGIDESIREHIFEPFFTTKDVGEGTGLGLSIAYGLIQEHGGWIEAANNESGGARFDIYLPGEMTS